MVFLELLEIFKEEIKRIYGRIDGINEKKNHARIEGISRINVSIVSSGAGYVNELS